MEEAEEISDEIEDEPSTLITKIDNLSIKGGIEYTIMKNNSGIMVENDNVSLAENYRNVSEEEYHSCENY